MLSAQVSVSAVCPIVRVCARACTCFLLQPALVQGEAGEGTVQQHDLGEELTKPWASCRHAGLARAVGLSDRGRAAALPCTQVVHHIACLGQPHACLCMFRQFVPAGGLLVLPHHHVPTFAAVRLAVGWAFGIGGTGATRGLWDSVAELPHLLPTTGTVVPPA